MILTSTNNRPDKNFIPMIKNTPIRKLLLVLFTAMLPGLSMASLSVKITTVSGESVVIPITETPKVSVVDGNVQVGQNNNATLEFPLADCPRFELGDFVSVENLDMSLASIRYAEGQIFLTGFRPGIRATVHTLSGMLFTSGVTDSNGNLVLDMQGGLPGIYIVSTPSINTKLVIK